MRKIRFILKSGRQIVFTCEEATIRAVDNNMIGYSLNGLKDKRPLYVRIDDISMVIDEGPVEDEDDDS